MIINILFAIFMWVTVLYAVSSLFPSIFEERVIKFDRGRRAKKSDYIFIIFAGIGWMIIYYNAIYGCLWFLSEDISYFNLESGLAEVRAALAGTVSLWLTAITYMQLKRLNISEILLKKKKKKESL